MAVQYQRGRGRPAKTRMLALQRRLPRRHRRGDERVRPGVRDALDVRRRASRAAVRTPATPAASTPTSPSGPPRPRRSSTSTPTSWPRSSASRCSKAPAACTSTTRDCLQVLRRLADEHDLLLIFDEIATGFGRTGTYFAAEHAAVSPDIMCVGKALSGGYLTLAATLCTRRGRRRHRATASRACSCTARRSWPTRSPARWRWPTCDVLDDRGWQTDVARIEAGLVARPRPGAAARRSRRRPRPGRRRGHPARPPGRRRRPPPALRARNGVWIRPFRDLIYTMPPYITDDDDLATICAAMIAAASA